MTNADTSIARRFHDTTKYTLRPVPGEESEIMMGIPPDLYVAIGEQNPEIEPYPFKVYTSLDPIPLPREPRSIGLSALDAIAATGESATIEAAPDLAALAHICLRSLGVLKSWTNASGKTFLFRGAGCTGARYHLEIYLVCGKLPDLDAGVYHYSAEDHSLRQLRAGDFRAEAVAATGDEPATADAPVIAVVTTTVWRNAWRYQDRAYRHVYWDAGTLLANILPLAADAGLPARVVLGYADDQINALVDVDGDREATVAMIALGRTGEPAPASPPVTRLDLPTRQISAREITFPLIQEMHHASELESGAEAAAWRAHPLHREPVQPTGQLVPLPAIDPANLPHDSIDTLIERRRSNRHYVTETPLPLQSLAAVLQHATNGTSLDTAGLTAQPLHDLYLIVNNVEGLEPGSYVHHPRLNALELLSAGDQREIATRLACEQDYAADAHVNVYTLTDLQPILKQYGNRGYRLAQLEAALVGGRVQLAAHALGLGAVGSTSVDDEVTAHFSPHAAGKSFMFIAVFGPSRRATRA
jgi:SagB-type dehydrogenase family enzyme